METGKNATEPALRPSEPAEKTLWQPGLNNLPLVTERWYDRKDPYLGSGDVTPDMRSTLPHG